MLERLGYPRPREDQVAIDLMYASQLLRMPPGAMHESGAIVAPVPGRPTGMAIVRYEHDTVMFAVFGMAGNDPPVECTAMCDYAEDFAPAHLLAAVRAAEPLEEAVQHRFPASRWRRYDKVRQLPDGLLVVGDAVCSFNPIYGQGMTVAALEATVLRDCLRRGERDLPRRFFRASAKYVRIAWQTAVGSDLALPEITGSRPLLMRLSNAYLEKVLTAAENDAAVAGQFLRVIAMIDPPSRLMRPAFLLRVAYTNRRRPTAAHQPEKLANSIVAGSR
jgi:2-polyprenyl-6-methoxyphenol hydroxylase-like FAD-dependent oxidoreductase